MIMRININKSKSLFREDLKIKLNSILYINRYIRLYLAFLSISTHLLIDGEELLKSSKKPLSVNAIITHVVLVMEIFCKEFINSLDKLIQKYFYTQKFKN